jgi:very-short-patch-repair endonuclease
MCFASAARLHRLPVGEDGLIHVIVPSPRPSRHPIRVHRLDLAEGDVENAGCARVTSLRRTVIDCLGRLGPDQSDGLLAWIISRRILGTDELSEWVDQNAGAWGNRRRRTAIDRLRTGAASTAEWRLQALLRNAGITGWRGGESLIGHVGVAASADVYFPDVRLVIEVDGRRFHGADRFQSERTRQNALVAAGCTVLRYTWEDIVNRPAQVVAQIRAQLATLRSR